MMSKSDSEKGKKGDEESFDWVQLKRELATDKTGQTRPEQQDNVEKFKRKFKENPFIPIGCGLTTVCLLMGLHFFGRKKSDMSQVMMRGRILAQGFTIAGLVGGIIYNIRGRGVKK